MSRKMRTNGLRATLAMLSALLWACGGGGEEAPGDGAEKSAQDGRAEEEHGHSHADASGGHEHGTVRHELGEQTEGAWKATAQQADDVIPGGETVFYVTVTGESKPAAVRLWVGDAQASQSTKVLAEPIDENRSHAHVEIPDPLAAGDQFHLELDDGKGGVERAAFNLAAGAVLPPQGPHTGFVATLADGAGFAEIKLHDDKGDLEVWLAQDRKMAQPFDLPAGAVVTAEFPDKGKSVELRPRNNEKNEDEEGRANMREGKTNYFIFPGKTGSDSAWLKGDFRSPVRLTIKSGEANYSAGPVTLVPHTHGPAGHHH